MCYISDGQVTIVTIFPIYSLISSLFCLTWIFLLNQANCPKSLHDQKINETLNKDITKHCLLKDRVWSLWAALDWDSVSACSFYYHWQRKQTPVIQPTGSLSGGEVKSVWLCVLCVYVCGVTQEDQRFYFKLSLILTPLHINNTSSYSVNTDAVYTDTDGIQQYILHV